MFVSRCDKVIVKCNTVADGVRCPQKIKKSSTIKVCLVVLFKQQFLLFKQHNIYFYNTFLPTCIFTTLKQHY